jgi:hypothetical protein
MLVQLAPVAQRIMQAFAPLIDQPVIRKPYSMSLAQSQVIPASSSVVLTPTDFSYSFEWPFEAHEMKFSQDPAHTSRDWRVVIVDGTFNQPLEKAQTGAMVADLIDDNTGKWVWKFPWVVRPKGGQFQIVVTNLDTVNPITVDLSFLGYQMIPR